MIRFITLSGSPVWVPGGGIRCAPDSVMILLEECKNILNYFMKCLFDATGLGPPAK